MKKLLILTLLFVLLAAPAVGFCASVTPSLIELEAGQEDVLTSLVTIINPDVVDQTYYFDTLVFTANDESGSPQFIPKDQDYSGLATWISFSSESVVVPAGSKGEVPFSIFVPDSALPGGYYAAITVSNAPEDVVATNGAIIDAKTAVLVLLTVSGDQTISAQILDFVQTSSDEVQSGLNGEYEFRIQNQGNVHVLPVGTVELKDVFGRVLASNQVNEGEGRVLPDSTRTYTAKIDDGATGWMEIISTQMRHLAIGPVSAVLTLEYGSDQVLVSEIDAFWYLPWQLLVSILGLLVVCILIFGIGRRSTKR